MDQAEFIGFVDKVFVDCKRILDKKRKYREDPNRMDRLDQFKKAGTLSFSKASSAVAGMMSKHTTQLYTMVEEEHNGIDVPLKDWKETIYDHINYLLLLLAALSEEKGE